jgi:hypothetical protein
MNNNQIPFSSDQSYSQNKILMDRCKRIIALSQDPHLNDHVKNMEIREEQRAIYWDARYWLKTFKNAEWWRDDLT